MKKNLVLSIIGYFAGLLLLLVLFLGLFIWWAISPISLPLSSKLEINFADNDKEIIAPKDLITVATYNIGHGQGIKEHAEDYRGKEITLDHLNKLAVAMKKIDADIYFLQEVDLDAKRTQHINQIKYINDKLGYPFYACALVWEKNYVPYPFFPIEHQIGYVRSANCIISKYKISNHERIILPKPKNNPFWYNLGYIDRGIERVDVEIGATKIALLNLHLEAWDASTRFEQVKLLMNYMKAIPLPIILGGDFNTIMPSDPIKTGFADEPETNYNGEGTLVLLFESMRNLKIPSINKAGDDPFLHYTFPSNAPTRKIDHIFLLGSMLSFKDYYVANEAQTASDHLPVVAKIMIAKAN